MDCRAWFRRTCVPLYTHQAYTQRYSFGITTHSIATTSQMILVKVRMLRCSPENGVLTITQVIVERVEGLHEVGLLKGRYSATARWLMLPRIAIDSYRALPSTVAGLIDMSQSLGRFPAVQRPSSPRSRPPSSLEYILCSVTPLVSKIGLSTP